MGKRNKAWATTFAEHATYAIAATYIGVMLPTYAFGGWKPVLFGTLALAAAFDGFVYLWFKPRHWGL